MFMNDQKGCNDVLMDHKIPQSDIDFFDQNGFLIVRNALDTEQVKDLITAGDQLIDSKEQVNRQCTNDGRYDGFRNTIALDSTFAELIDHERILPTVVQLLGASLKIMTSHLIYKYPDEAEVPDTHRMPGWHRDYLMATNDLGNVAIPRLLVKCAYYLTDLREKERGVTMVAPGSHLLTHPPVIPANQKDPLGALEPSLEPGDCLIFENRTFHAGALHRGSEVRKTIMMGYGCRWVMPMDYVSQSKDVLATLSPIQRFLVGEPYEEVEAFQPDGGKNPIVEWCNERGIPTSRHPQVQR
jgi:ectoine hydroxylase-related dioxygenase (phytanoyl-CoA dioxygenase family)